MSSLSTQIPWGQISGWRRPEQTQNDRQEGDKDKQEVSDVFLVIYPHGFQTTLHDTAEAKTTKHADICNRACIFFFCKIQILVHF